MSPLHSIALNIHGEVLFEWVLFYFYFKPRICFGCYLRLRNRKERKDVSPVFYITVLIIRLKMVLLRNNFHEINFMNTFLYRIKSRNIFRLCVVIFVFLFLWCWVQGSFLFHFVYIFLFSAFKNFVLLGIFYAFSLFRLIVFRTELSINLTDKEVEFDLPQTWSLNSLCKINSAVVFTNFKVLPTKYLNYSIIILLLYHKIQFCFLYVMQ